MRFTKWGEYGLLFCVYLAKQKERAGASELGDAHQIPTQYAQQILHRLRKGGIIKSIRGPKGGFTLSKPPRDLTMKDILTASEGSTFEVMCDSNPVFESCSSDASPCSVKFVWRELKDKIDDALDSMDLETIAQKSDTIDLIQISETKKAS